MENRNNKSNHYIRNKHHSDQFYRELEEHYRRGFEHGYGQGYKRGYAHAQEDYYWDLRQYMRHDKRALQPVNLNPKNKWRGKKSLSWTWV